MVAAAANGEEAMDVDSAAAAAASQGKGVKRKRIYDDHRPMSSITAGIKNGTLHQVCVCLARKKSLKAVHGAYDLPRQNQQVVSGNADDEDKRQHSSAGCWPCQP